MNRTHLVVLLSGVLVGQAAAIGQSLPNLFPLLDASGFVETNNNGGGPIPQNGAFFQSLGTNGRSCSSCHRAAEGWGISAAEIQLRFLLTAGTDPIFRTNDGSNCNTGIDTSNIAGRLKAYSLLLSRGLIRIPLPVPANAEFNVVSVVNPYGCGDPATLSMYRRPLPTTNLRFLTTIMWDGRESAPQTGTQKIAFATNPADLLADLAHQAVDATNTHAQATTPLSTEQQQDIVNFEMGLATAQAFDFRAGALNAAGATGGPAAIPGQAFFIGINDPLGGNPMGTPFTPAIFNLFNAWANQPSNSQRASILRGQTLFNSKPINITGVGGLNDSLNLPSIPGTCGTCHSAPNAGDHSIPLPLNIGVADVDSPLNVNYLPVFTLQNKTTFAITTTTDVGRALVTGLWADIGKVKGPVLRGLASRAPYFHNGSAKSLADVITFYNTRFSIGFTEQEQEDLVAFLNAL